MGVAYSFSLFLYVTLKLEGKKEKKEGLTKKFFDA